MSQRAHLPTGQCHEDDAAKIVVVCAPSALSKMMGSLHPAGALYEKPVNTSKATESHDKLQAILKRNGIKVYEISDILRMHCDMSMKDRMDLENLAFQCLTYTFARNKKESKSNSSSATADLSQAERYYASDEYKRKVIDNSDVQQLVDIIFTNPIVTIHPSLRDTGFTASYTFEPLSNIIFVRDQQITTNKGIVMANLRSTQRMKEVKLLEFCLRKLNLNVIGHIPPHAYLEGGDFFPAGKDLSFIGIGPRSDWSAVQYLLRNDLLGTLRVAVVKDTFEKKQQRMHLDTVFSIIGSDCCVMLDDMMGEQSPTRRLVDVYEYHKDNDETDTGKYKLYLENIEFSKYMSEHLAYSIIPVTGTEQLNYGCNCLNLGNGHIVTIERNVARKIAAHPAFKGTVEYVDFSGVTTMYGGVHCASQVVYRHPVSPAPDTNGNNVSNGSKE